MNNFNKEVFEQDVFEVLAMLSKVPKEKITLQDSLADNLNLDSLKRMEALSRIADKYDLDPDLEEVMAIATVQDVMTSMQKYFENT